MTTGKGKNMSANQEHKSLAARQSEEIKTRLLALTGEQITALQLSYPFRLLQAYTRANGRLNIVLGSLTVFFGVGIPGNPPLKAFQTLFGVAIVLVSLWSIQSPKPSGIAAWAMILSIAGAWNIFLGATVQSLILIAFGLLQLWSAYSLYRSFYKHGRTTVPDPDALRTYDTLQRAMKNLDIRGEKDPDYFQLRRGRSWWHGFF